jgi:hypothetical protein
MRRVTARDLPTILRQIGAPTHVKKQLLGNLYSDAPNPGSPEYDENTIWSGTVQEMQAVTGAAPVATVDSVNNLAMLQHCPADAPGYTDISWTVINYNNAGVVQIAGNAARVVIVVENLGATLVAVSFGATAKAGVPAIVQGFLLESAGSTLYIDRYCPTNTIYIDTNGGQVAFAQATRSNALPPFWTVTDNNGGP